MLVAQAGELEPASQHRIDDDPVSIELDDQEFAPSPDRCDPLSDEGEQLVRRAAEGERRRRRGRVDRTTGEGGMEGFGDDRQIGKFGHGRPIVAARKRVLDSPGPERQDS